MKEAYDPIAHGARCDLCPLNRQRLSGEVTPVPPTKAKGVVRLLLVTESPTRTEEKQGSLLSGRSGGLVKPLLTREGISLRDVHVTPAALCRSESDKDADSAAKCCAPRLLRELYSASPDGAAPTLTLGKHATLALLGVSNLLVARGFLWKVPRIPLTKVKELEKVGKDVDPNSPRVLTRRLKAETLRWRRKLKGRVVLPTLALSFVLRADTWAAMLRLDIRRLGRWVRGEIAELEDDATYKVWPGIK